MADSKTFALFLLLTLAPVASALADCPETPAGSHVFMGVDVSIPAYIHDRPHVRELDLLRVQLAWVPQDEETRYRDQYLVDIDWVNQTSSNVHIWDGELEAIRVHDAFPAKLSWSNRESGQIQLTACEGVFWSEGPPLMFAYYGVDGEIFHDFTRVVPAVRNGWPSTVYIAVTNEEVSSHVVDTFNGDLDRRIIDDTERATGVEPGHYLAQSLLFQTLGPSVHQLVTNPSRFFDATNAVVKQNRVYVTGNDASARVPLSMESVFSNGRDIMDSNRLVSSLENHLGIVQFKSRFEPDRGLYNMVFDARPDISIETEPCVDGRSRITADFVYPSEIPGRIHLYIEDSPGAMNMDPSLNQGVYCDHDYRVVGQRIFEGTTVDTGTIWVPIDTKGVMVKIRYSTGAYPAPMASPSIETVLELWGVEDIESLYGTHEFFCDKADGGEVDTIDEIAFLRNNLLTPEQQAEMGPYSDMDRNDRAWADSDGDGTICDKRDERSDNGDGESISWIELAVYPSTQ